MALSAAVVAFFSRTYSKVIDCGYEEPDEELHKALPNSGDTSDVLLR
jgi:hypothetical protein